MSKMEKKGKLAAEYLAVIVLVLLLLIVLIIFSRNLRDKAIEGITSFVKNVIGRR